jgi:hypothetical protein
MEIVNDKTFTEKKTIQLMCQWQRFPIPEQLMNKPPGFKLQIDSIITQLYSVEHLVYNQSKAPCKVP